MPLTSFVPALPLSASISSSTSPRVTSPILPRRRPSNPTAAVSTPPLPPLRPRPSSPFPPPPPPPPHLSSDEELQRALATAGHRIAVLKVYSRRCRSCMGVRRPYERTASKERYRAAFFQFCAEDNVEMARSLGLRAFPTFIIFADGKRVDHFAGSRMKPIIQAIDDHS